MSQFTEAERKAFNRLLMLQEILSDLSFHGETCPALASQLNDAKVFSERFICEIRTLQENNKPMA